MKTLKERIADVSSYLQSLLAPNVFPEVKEAVEKKDETLLISACRKAKIPDKHMSSMVPLLLSVGPNQKWPAIL